MKWVLAILLILIGAVLFSITIGDMGEIGHIIMKIISFGCLFLAGFIVRSRGGKNLSS
ncbi:hypothetical protein [Ornithinibacillus bavariensis]|uniref:hypothetical protein n=1 Tax=Ornithinibacillus bavariensis TaxID=545502 RepID=UPI003D1C78B7